MTLAMQHRQTGELVEAFLFTGVDANRQPTRDFVGRTIVIRQGRFLHDIGYVYAGEWLVKNKRGALTKFAAVDLHKFYKVVSNGNNG